MLKGFKFKGISSGSFPYLVVNKPRRSMLPSLSEKLQSVPYRAGAYDFGVDIGVRRFDFDITIIETSPEQFYTSLRELSEWLYSEELEELVIEYEPDKTYKARLAGDTNLDSIASFGTGTISFLCPDPYAYGAEVPINVLAGTGSTVVNRKGTAKSYPKFAFTVNSPTTFLSVFKDDKDYLMLGTPFDVTDQTGAVQEELFLADPCTNIANWTAGGTIDYGWASGTMGSNGVAFTATDYGTGSQWHGPSMERSLGASLTDFRVDFTITQDNLNPAAVGRVELYLKNAAGTVIGKISMRDGHPNGMRNSAEIKVGSGSNVFYVNNDTAEAGQWNNFDGGLMRFERIGKQFSFIVTRVDQDGNFFATKRFTWYDENGIHQQPLEKLQISIQQHSTYPTTFQQIEDIKVYKINALTETQVPYIAEAGDIIEVDHATGAILKNGEPMQHLLNPTSTLFALDATQELKIMPADVDTTITYKERYL